MIYSFLYITILIKIELYIIILIIEISIISVYFINAYIITRYFYIFYINSNFLIEIIIAKNSILFFNYFKVFNSYSKVLYNKNK